MTVCDVKLSVSLLKKYNQSLSPICSIHVHIIKFVKIINKNPKMEIIYLVRRQSVPKN